MEASLPDLLIQDHLRIRAELAKLIEECDRKNADEEACLELFRNLKALVVSHAKAEEYALYAYFENAVSEEVLPHRHLALEGYEEHDLIDFLMKEMVQAEELTPQWRAQVTVLSGLLDHHMLQEERGLLIQARAVIEPKELVDLGLEYTRERDAIFAKKINPKRPVIPHQAATVSI